MSKRIAAFFLVDILQAIDRIRRFSNKFHSGKELLGSEVEYDAVMRELEIIGEATRNVLLLHPNNAPRYFRRVVDFRNLISHGYFGIDADEVWGIITGKLETLELDIKNILLQEPIPERQSAINSAIEEASERGHETLKKYLFKVQKELSI